MGARRRIDGDLWSTVGVGHVGRDNDGVDGGFGVWCLGWFPGTFREGDVMGGWVYGMNGEVMGISM